MHRISRKRWGSGASPPAFSLIELVIVVVITGIIAAIAIPRLTRSGQASGAAALTANLQSLRKAIELYRVDHGAYPTCVELTGNKTTVMFQLTQFTDAAGNYSATRTATHRFGPYLRQIPQNPLTAKTGVLVVNGGPLPAADESQNYGWMYDPTTMKIKPNNSGTDLRGVPFANY